MQTKDDISYGVIPLIHINEQWNVFLINQISFGGDEYWTFPKGHPEINESPEETALRELKEETNILLSNLDTSKSYEQSYSFSCEGEIINKKAVYFLGIASSKTYSVQEAEVKDAGWYSIQDALKKLTYDKAKVLLQEVITDLPDSSS